MIRPRGLLLLPFALLLLAQSAPATSVRELLAGTPLEGKADEILAGRKVTTTAHRSGEREMAVAFACLVPAGQRTSLDVFRNADAVMPEEYRDADGPIDLRDLSGSFAKLGLGAKGKTEAQRYLAAEPGWELGLSSEEIAALRGLTPANGQEVAAVEDALRRFFADRTRSYHDRGLAGIARFDRGGGEVSSVADDLQATTLASKSFASTLPETWRALQEFPGAAPPDGEVFYFWTRIDVLGRPVFLLNQRLIGSPDGIPTMIERQFYATQFLAAGQTITTLVPVDAGTLVLYINHSFVDRWGGPAFTQGTKRKVGQKLIEQILPTMAETLGLCEGRS